MGRRPGRNRRPVFKAILAVAAIKGEKNLIELDQFLDLSERIPMMRPSPPGCNCLMPPATPLALQAHALPHPEQHAPW
jgi:hypothetical protein